MKRRQKYGRRITAVHTGMHSASAQPKTAQKKLFSLLNAAAAPIKKRFTEKGMRKTIRVLVAGVPNVGKSAIINRLKGRKSAKEGDKPGVTRGLQWVRLSDDLELLDSPGLLWPKIESQDAAAKIAVLGSLKHEVLDQTALSLSLIGMLRTAAPGAIRPAMVSIRAKKTIQCLRRSVRKEVFYKNRAK